ncbi:hypothetical protein BDV12DRAFT_69335 [Aspergillus spectabilis]
MVSSEKPTVVFIPGAWNLPGGFDAVRTILTTRGYPSVAVTLPSVGADQPTKNLSDDTECTRRVIEQLTEEGKQVLVVAHSYAGLVGAGAVKDLGYAQRRAARKQGGVVMLIYMAAFVANKGSSVLDLLGGNPLPWMNFADDNYIYLTDAANILYNDLPPSEQEKWIAKLKPMSKPAFLEAVSHEPWHELPCMYLLCERDNALPISLQEAMADMLGKHTSFRCVASHTPFLSVPGKVADAVELGAQEGIKESAITGN